MNIFFLDENPTKAASYLFDRHVVKMPLEYVQILSTACRQAGLDIGYKATHINHPCVKWAGESAGNYQWLYTIATCTFDEYTFRYGKKHKSEEILYSLPFLTISLPTIYGTPYPQAMPDIYRHADPIRAYRQYYRSSEKAHLAKWTKREPPSWFSGDDEYWAKGVEA